MNHYKWLEMNLEAFTKSLGFPHDLRPSIIAHGDKCYSYKHKWESNGIPFAHGVAIYLLTYWRPYSMEVRETSTGWVPVDQWIVDNYHRFKDHF